jgi:hypothetical protein
MKRVLPTIMLTLALASPAFAADKTGVREVCAKSTYVKNQPGRVVIGTLFKHQKIDVSRYHGKWAYGFAKGHANKHGWVLTADLCS